jgi:predicted metal-dependent HD superfamily phosphohydrolase
MLQHEHGCPDRAQHLIKVYALAKAIGEAENLPPVTQYTLELAALLHDVGIRPCLEQTGHCTPREQEAEGARVAAPMLQSLGVEETIAERICFLIAHHHTTAGVDGPDWRILLEADYLVNAYEGNQPEAAIRAAESHFFATETGKMFLQRMFGLK